MKREKSATYPAASTLLLLDQGTVGAYGEPQRLRDPDCGSVGKANCGGAEVARQHVLHDRVRGHADEVGRLVDAVDEVHPSRRLPHRCAPLIDLAVARRPRDALVLQLGARTHLSNVMAQPAKEPVTEQVRADNETVGGKG